MDSDLDYEMAEVNCSCGWYGSADSLEQYKPLGEQDVQFHCPRCGANLLNEKLWCPFCERGVKLKEIKDMENDHPACPDCLRFLEEKV